MNSNEKTAKEPHQSFVCSLLITFGCLFSLHRWVYTCNYLFPPGSAQVLLIPFQECAAYVFPRIKSLPDLWIQIPGWYLRAWLFKNDSCVCRGWGGGTRKKQRNKGKSGKKDLTWLQRNWIYKSGNLGALLHSRSNETQALLTSSSNPRTVVAVVGTDRGLSPKAAGNRLHCKIICGDNKVLRMRMRLRSFFKRFPDELWHPPHLFQRIPPWKKADPSASGEVVECDMISCTWAPSCLSFGDEGSSLTWGWHLADITGQTVLACWPRVTVPHLSLGQGMFYSSGFPYIWWNAVLGGSIVVPNAKMNEKPRTVFLMFSHI